MRFPTPDGARDVVRLDAHAHRAGRTSILLVIDGARASRCAAGYLAHVIAHQPNFAVRLLAVQQPPPPTLEAAAPHGATPSRKRSRSRRAWRARARAHVTRALDDARAVLCAVGIPAGGVAIEVRGADDDDFADLVLRVARRYRCGTIVVAARPPSWLRRLLGESLGEALVRRNRGSAIWVVPSTSPASAPERA